MIFFTVNCRPQPKPHKCDNKGNYYYNAEAKACKEIKKTKECANPKNSFQTNRQCVIKCLKHSTNHKEH